VVTIPTKDVGEVKDKFCGNYEWTLEKGCEDYIKREMKINESR